MSTSSPMLKQILLMLQVFPFYIKDLLAKFNLDFMKIVSQGYDGASVMSGRCAGVQAKVREFAPNAIYIHCYAIWF